MDGGQIPTNEKTKPSFEALSAVIYQLESIRTMDTNHREIELKSCAFSAQEEDLYTIKTYVLNAALKQGLDQDTAVTALADGIVGQLS